MTVRTALLTLMLLAGCATTSPQPVPSAAAPAAPAPGTISPVAPPSGATATPSPAAAGPSDWALAIVGTPFVFDFRTVVCAATAVVAGPTAGLLAFSHEREAGLAYVRDGLAQNCGPPYAVPVPVAAAHTAESDARYYPEPEVRRPRSLTPYSSAAVTSP
jgi:hypothetical protein